MEKEYLDNVGGNNQMRLNTYKQCHSINRLFSGWHRIYQHLVKPYLVSLNRPARILDIGCGTGDVLFSIQNYAKQDDIELQLHGIDPDQRAIDFARSSDETHKILFEVTNTRDLCATGAQYDVVINNYVLHHLTADELLQLIKDAQTLCTGMILFNDLQRSDIAYLGFSLIGHLFYHNSFHAHDGCVSIKRSYTRDELIRLLPSTWQVKKSFPYHLLAYRNP